MKKVVGSTNAPPPIKEGKIRRNSKWTAPKNGPLTAFYTISPAAPRHRSAPGLKSTKAYLLADSLPRARVHNEPGTWQPLLHGCHIPILPSTTFDLDLVAYQPPLFCCIAKHKKERHNASPSLYLRRLVHRRRLIFYFLPAMLAGYFNMPDILSGWDLPLSKKEISKKEKGYQKTVLAYCPK